MTGAPRLPPGLLLATLLLAVGSGCATASRATSAPEPAQAPPPPARVARRAPPAKVAPERPPPKTAPERPPTKPPPEVLPFEPSTMTRPERVSGREPELTPEAVARRVRGTALIRCVVTREGHVENCRLLNHLPHMDEVLLETVSTWRVTPATRAGQPLDVDYTFVIRLPAG
jgi:periplasmic protein TonB